MTLISGMPLAVRSDSGICVRLELEDLAPVGEEEHVVAGVGDDHVAQRVLFAQHLPADALAAAPLDAVGVRAAGA